MEVRKLALMTRGWFVGAFTPSAFETDAVEVAVKSYEAGDMEEEHYHKVATEITAILEGTMKFNEIEAKAGDIIVIFPGESVKFSCLEPGKTVVVKVPGVLGDKYLNNKV